MLSELYIFYSVFDCCMRSIGTDREESTIPLLLFTGPLLSNGCYILVVVYFAAVV
jgi:hypothetical protein